MEKFYTVYIHTNKNNGKVYIGITSQKIYNRWKNGFGYTQNLRFWRAIKKYGWDNFEHVILYKGLNENEAKQKEIELIKKYDSTNPKCGYNNSKGGDIFSDIARLKLSIANSGRNNGMYGKTHSEEYKKKVSDRFKGKKLSPEQIKKISIANKGKKRTEQTRQKLKESHIGHKPSPETLLKMSEVHSGEKNHFYRKTHSNEVKEKLRILNTGENSHVAKQVICLTTGEVFVSISQAASKYGISGCSIGANCRKDKYKSAGKLPDGTKLIWMYYEDYIAQQNNQAS